MILFVVSLTAFFGTASVHELVFPCPDVVCVVDLENHAQEADEITRVRVWRSDNYSPLKLSGQSVWPPIIDLHKA